MDERVIEVWADTKGYAMCNGPTCKTRLLWAELVKSGKKMCFNGTAAVVGSRSQDGRLVEAFAFKENHWASCPDRRSFKR